MNALQGVDPMDTGECWKRVLKTYEEFSGVDDPHALALEQARTIRLPRANEVQGFWDSDKATTVTPWQPPSVEVAA